MLGVYRGQVLGPHSLRN